MGIKYRPMFGNPVELKRFIRDYYTNGGRDDKGLLLEVWNKYGLNLDDEQELTFREQCPTPETIFRLKRKMREQGEI